MLIPVVRLAPNRQWDQTLVDDLLSGALYPHGLAFKRLDSYPRQADGIVLIVPGRYWADHTAEISAAISRYRWVLGIRCGDEEDLFDVTAVEHPAIKWWIQTPRVGKDYGTARFLPLGYTPHFKDLPADLPGKHLATFLSAQCTHARRMEAFDALDRAETRGFATATDGFTKGMPPTEYARLMCAAKVAPAPSGAVSPDSFRLYEALEAHAIPIADDISPAYDSRGYWLKLFPDAPFPILTDYANLPGWVDDLLADWPRTANRVAAWWIAQKRRMAGWLIEDLQSLVAGAGFEPAASPPSGALSVTGYSVHLPRPSQAELARSMQGSRSSITVVVPVSPIRSHPATQILDETLDSVRHHLPNSEIILTFDGVRLEQGDRRRDYEEFIRRALWRADHVYGNVWPLIFDTHQHQTGMMRAVLDRIDSPLLMYVEQDTPLVTDEAIDLEIIASYILAGSSNVIRLHHEGVIPAEHEHMCHGTIVYTKHEDQDSTTASFILTSQWSQRPHVASVAFYRRIMRDCFTPDARSFIEDRMHGVLDEAYRVDGIHGWRQYGVHIYKPGENLKRSYHTDGRAGESKYDGTQVF